MGSSKGCVFEHCVMTFSADFIRQASILIDRSCHACLADFESLTTVSDSMTLNSSAQDHSGAARWMSPELVDSEFHGRRWSSSSDRYALGMVIYEVLSGYVPFYQHADLSIPGKVVEGDRPERPQGVGGAGFTDPVWKMLKRCWVAQPKNRPTIEEVLRCLENHSRAWTPPSLLQVAVPLTTDSLTVGTFELIGKESIGADGRIRKGEEAKKVAEGEGGRREEGEEKAAEAEKPKLAKEVEEWGMQDEGEVIENPTPEGAPEEVLEVISRQDIPETNTPIATTAGTTEDPGHISYPEGANGPKLELNVNSRKGKFR